MSPFANRTPDFESPPGPAAGPARKVYRVSELNRWIKGLLEDEIGEIWLEGEVSNLRRPSSGHVYFTLKDEKSEIAAVMFRGDQARMKLDLRDGLKVRALGRVTVYEPRGQYQIVCRQIEEAGIGSLQEAFEKLKRKLEAEGLFDPARKKPLPRLPRHIGLVTSTTGAAIRDILNVIDRRFPNLHIVIAPTRVQGEGAAEIAEAIRRLNRLGGIDVMIVGRGGGSIEDLWAFNEEVVARAVAASAIPVISAVGHEIDFTICDFVADRRAETPSAAAELIVGPKAEFEEKVGRLRDRIVRETLHLLRRRQQQLDEGCGRLVRRVERQAGLWRRRIQSLQSRLSGLSPQARLKRHMQFVERARGALLETLSRRVKREERRLSELALVLRHAVRTALRERGRTQERLRAQLLALDPTRVLNRGYSITRAADGAVVTRHDQVRPGDRLETLLARGRLISQSRKPNPENAMAEKKAAKQEQTFEQALERLDVIVKEMEEGSLSLETMMAHFEEGMETVKFCTNKLNEVEKKIELLVEKNGELSTVPFEPEA